MKTFNCETIVSDARCPDGCCGDIMLSVVSPKTGRTVRCSLHISGVASKVAKTLPGKFCESRGRMVMNARGLVEFTSEELRTLLSRDGQFDPC